MTRSVLQLQRDNLLLSALVDGPEQGAVAMLVHGFPDTPHSWNGVAEGLVQAGYQVVRPWLRGYTPGSINPDAAYDPFNAGLDLLAWRAKFEGRDVHLVGHDWGAVAAMAAAATDAQAWKTLTDADNPNPQPTRSLPSKLSIGVSTPFQKEHPQIVGFFEKVE